MLKLIRNAVCVCALLALYSTSARAASIGPDCGTCQGSIYTLDITKANFDLNLLDGVSDTYLVTLSINTTGYTGGGVAIDEVAVKISSGIDGTPLLLAAPGSTLDWGLLSGGIGALGCNGTGGGYECSYWSGAGGSAATIPNVLTWTFAIDISGAVFSFDSIDPNLLPSIKVRYVDDTGKKVGSLVSEKVPEPTTLGLLGVGVAVGVLRRRGLKR